MIRPKLVVLTPVRNEAWILTKFISAASLWADHIIIADQMSDDGSREIALSFPKVTLIDNPTREMHMAATRRLLLKEACKIPGEKIVFALDADEFFDGDFLNTSGWKSIMESQIGDIFCWRWKNLLPNGDGYTLWDPYYWAVHIGDSFGDGTFPDNFIHEQRLPMPNTVSKEYVLDDLYSLHFARVNPTRQRSKEIYYQVVTFTNRPDESGVRLYRMYHKKPGCLPRFELEAGDFGFYQKNGIDLQGLFASTDVGQYYLGQVARLIEANGPGRYRKIDMWNGEDNDFSKYNPQRVSDKMMMLYLRITARYADSVFIRAIDKILKKLY